MRRTILLPLVGAVLLLAACGADDVPLSTGGTGTTEVSTPVTTVPEPIPDGADGLDLARARWADSGIEDYTMSYREVCFCPQTTVTVEVRGGTVVDTTVEQDPAVRAPDGASVDDLFAEIQEAVDGDAAEIRASYDQATGRPTSFWIDLSLNMADEEHGVDVTAFTADGVGSPGPTDVTDPTGPSDPIESVVTTGTSQPPLVAAVGQAQLTEMWGCGYGFAASNVERTVAVQLYPDTPPPTGISSVTLPDPSWAAEVQLGATLLGECTDVRIGPGPAITETWPVVGGTLEIDAPASQACSGGPPAKATVRDLSVVSPDGTTITFAGLTLTNDHWGCIPG